jgi:hypothetical protein
MNPIHTSTARRCPGQCSVALVVLLALTGALAMVALPATAATPDATARERATASFTAARGGQSEAVEAAASQWRAISDADPADASARAYAGAATAMLATTTMLPWRKLSFVDDGLALIDKALAQAAAAPDIVAPGGVAAGLEVRFVAANAFLALPEMFNRGARGTRLLDELVRSPQLASAPVRFQAAVWLRAGEQAIKEGRGDDARRWLERAAASGTPQAAPAQARLKTL